MRPTTEFKITIPKGRTCFYSTHDLIQGHVSLEFEKDTVIDELSITLEGKASIRVEEHVLLSNRAGYIFGDHTFLRMSHPVQSTDLPENRLARRRQSYIIPFDFTVPDALLPYACSHATADESVVRKAHLLLPPSLGTSRTDGIFINDLGPKRAKVTYSIHVRVRKCFPDGSSIILQKARPVCVIPTRDEEPPISIEENDPYYRFSHEKDVFQGPPAIGKAVGRLVANTAELPSLKLPHPCEDAGNSPTLTASVDLRFQPASQGEPPPRLDSITIKLHSFTFFGTLPYEIIPRPGDSHEHRAEHTQYMNTTRLGNCILKGVVWARQGPAAIAAKAESMQHRLSSEAAAISVSPTPISINDDQLSYYTTSLQIPIRLPRHTSKQSKQKFFTPTFSSCIMSRVYSLELKLSYKAASATSDESPKDITASCSIARYLTPRSHLVLRMPLQIRLGSGPSSSPRALVPQNHVLCDREGGQLDDGLDNLAAEQRPPTYTPVFRPR